MRAAIERGLHEIAREIESGAFKFSAALEDVHMNIEARLKEIAGEPAGRLHTARSRNDQVATDFRLWVRTALDAAGRGIGRLQRALLAQAERHVANDHAGLHAPPAGAAHHLRAPSDGLCGDARARSRAAYCDARARLNECPLGAAALAGTSFPLDRDMTAEGLGFDAPWPIPSTRSPRGISPSKRSPPRRSSPCISRALAEEIVLWVSPAFGFVQLSDAFTTGSSIMPQKRNPDAAELVRAKAGRIFGALQALLR